MKQFTITLSYSVLGIILLFGLVSCGGGGDGGGTTAVTATGVLKDNNVSGVTYASGGQTGITGTDGSFTYVVGQPIGFSVGGVTIGSSTGQGVVTPVDMVPNGTTSTPEVINIVRFLLMLDADGDPTNGIAISPAVQAIADTWPAVDFTASDLATELTTIISDASSADGTTHTLPDSATAQSHLESTLLCVRAGGYRGTFTGDDSGPFGVLVDASSGLLSGYAFSNADQALLTLTGTSAVSLDQNATFISGETSSGATFSGQFNGSDVISGNWNLSSTNESGTFSGNRIGGAADAVYRFTGDFTTDAGSPVTSYGVFTFDIDSANAVSGVAYTIVASDGTLDELAPFSGTLSGTSLSASIYDGSTLDTTISGTLDTAAGTVTGTWSDTSGNSGTFTGSGCQLN